MLPQLSEIGSTELIATPILTDDIRLVNLPRPYSKYVFDREAMLVYNAKRGTPVKPFISKRGRFNFTIRTDTNHVATVQRGALVLIVNGIFPPTSKHQVDHLNGDPTDDRLENLDWKTQGANIAAYYARPENCRKGAKNPNARFSEAQRQEIRELYRSGLSQTDIAEQFATNQSTISRICNSKK